MEKHLNENDSQTSKSDTDSHSPNTHDFGNSSHLSISALLV